MSTPPSPRDIEAQQDLFDSFRQITFSQGPLEREQLENLKIYSSQFDLADAEAFPQYFLPATPDRLASLEHRRPELRSDLTTNEDFITGHAYFQSTTMSAIIQNQLDNYGRDSPGMLDATRWKSAGSASPLIARPCFWLTHYL